MNGNRGLIVIDDRELELLSENLRSSRLDKIREVISVLEKNLPQISFIGISLSAPDVLNLSIKLGDNTK